MKTNFVELFKSVGQSATPVQKWGFASFWAGKAVMLLSGLWIIVPTAGAFIGVPTGDMLVSRTTLGSVIILYGLLISMAAGIAIYDHYVNRLGKGHWEHENDATVYTTQVDVV